MSDILPHNHIEIVEYSDKYAKNDQIRDLCFKNFFSQVNINTFNGVHLAMKWKYGHLVYLIFFASLLSSFTLAFLTFSELTEWPSLWVITSSVTVSILSTYYIFGVYFVNRNFTAHKTLGAPVFNNLSIYERFIKEGGKFFLAVIHNPNNHSYQVVGHLGCFPRTIKSEGDEEKSEIQALHLSMFGVSQAIRGGGLGKKLFQEAISFAKVEGYNRLTLHVWNINTVGLNIYKKFGFEISDESYIGEPLTGLINLEMTKKLN